MLDKPEFIPMSSCLAAMIGSSNDALDAAAVLVDGWFKGKETELVAAIKSLKRGEGESGN